MSKTIISKREDLCLISVASTKQYFVAMKTSLLNYEGEFATFSFHGQIFEGTIIATGDYSNM